MNENGGNGNGDGTVYVPFAETELSVEHASRVLNLIWERDRPLLAACIGEAYTGARLTASRQRKAQ